MWTWFFEWQSTWIGSYALNCSATTASYPEPSCTALKSLFEGRLKPVLFLSDPIDVMDGNISSFDNLTITTSFQDSCSGASEDDLIFYQIFTWWTDGVLVIAIGITGFIANGLTIIPLLFSKKLSRYLLTPNISLGTINKWHHGNRTQIWLPSLSIMLK